MATATKKARTAAQDTGGALAVSASISMQFLIVEDNSSEYHWTLRDGDGESLARSPSFASYRDAERAAGVVLDGAGSARLERHARGHPLDIVARDATLADEDSDAERGVDEGGSLNGKALRK
jgi:hypothetical protein